MLPGGRPQSWKRSVRDEEVIFHVERARRLLGAFEELAGLQEVPTLLARHRAVRDALEEMAELLDRAIEEMHVLRADRRLAELLQALQLEVEAVEHLPHLAGDLM